MDVAVLKLVKMNQAKIISDLGFALGLGDLLHSHSKLDILSDCQPREKTELLKNQNAVGSRPLYRRVIDQNIARRLLMKPGDQMKQRGLPATGGTDNAEELAGLNLQANIFERDEPMVRVCTVVQANVS